MNRHLCINRSMVFASLLAVAGFAGACATQTADGRGGGAGVGAGDDSAWATREAADLQWRQAAVARAFLSRAEEVAAAGAHPDDPGYLQGYEAAARHMLARAESRLNAYGFAGFEGAVPPSEADAVARADVRRIASEYATQAVSLQREVVRMERRAALHGGGINEVSPAAADLRLLLSLGNAVVALPLNTGSGASGGGGAGASTPTVAQSGGAAAPSEGAAADEASKRRGFTTHPGYVPSDK